MLPKSDRPGREREPTWQFCWMDLTLSDQIPFCRCTTSSHFQISKFRYRRNFALNPCNHFLENGNLRRCHSEYRLLARHNRFPWLFKGVRIGNSAVWKRVSKFAIATWSIFKSCNITGEIKFKISIYYARMVNAHKHKIIHLLHCKWYGCIFQEEANMNI